MRTTAVWRLGVPAVLMVGFALIGLAGAPRRGDDAPRPARAVAPAPGFGTTATRTGRTVTPAVEATAEGVDAGDEPPGPDLARTDEPAVPSPRLPEELEPAAPDVVVAMGPGRLEAGPPLAVAHVHVSESAHDGTPGPAMLDGAPAPIGDDILAPEPGAAFWFGPRGLERVRILGEIPR